MTNLLFQPELLIQFRINQRIRSLNSLAILKSIKLKNLLLNFPAQKKFEMKILLQQQKKLEIFISDFSPHTSYQEGQFSLVR